MPDSKTILLQHLDRQETLLQNAVSVPEQWPLFLAALEEFGELALAADFSGLLDLCLIFRDILASWRSAGITTDAMDFSVLSVWPDSMRSYLAEPESDSHKDALIQLISYPAWGTVIDPDTAAMLRGLLDLHGVPSGGSRPVTTELDLGELAAPEAGFPSVSETASTEVVINPALPGQLRELIGIMVTELMDIRTTAQKIRDLVQAGNGEDSALTQLWQEMTRTLEYYSDAVRSIEFHGLSAIVTRVHANLAGSDTRKTKPLAALIELVLEWMDVMLGYLQNPISMDRADALLDFMQREQWQQPLSSEEAHTVSALFKTLPGTAAADKKPARLQQAGAEDVSLVLPDDVDQDLLEAMLQELPAQVEALTAALQRLNSGGEQDDILIAKRIAHTLKGAGNTVGIRGVATLTHHLEDILLALHKQETLPGPHIMQTFLNAADCLATMSESLLGTGDPPADAQAVLQEVLDMANIIDQQGVTVLNAMTSATPAATVRPQREHEETAAAGKVETGEREVVPMLRIPAAFVDNLLRLVGESKITTGQINNFIYETLREMKDLRHCFDQLQLLGAKVQELTDIKDLNKAQQRLQTSAYDALEMDIYTELHTYSKWLAEATVDAHEISRSVTSNLTSLHDMLAVQARLHNETQENIMQARMLPVETHAQRLHRCVRQAAKLTGKSVELQLVGGSTLLDSETLNALLDPLMHLLRNAVDHGIENREERLALNKPEHGTITLTFVTDGNNIIIQCRDDGRGLDLDAIRRKALARGLLREDQAISDAELKQFILRPDFSTKEETTQVSGRGIGMDAVLSSISALSGTLNMDSEAGKGCTMRIRLPQNTLTQFALLVRMGPRHLVIASRDIVTIVHHENGKLRKSGDDWAFETGTDRHRAIPIEKLLNIFLERRSEERRPRTAILYMTESGMTAVMVEKILSSGDYVVKRLGNYIPNIPGILGVTLLGDGMVAPVLDVAELLRHPLSADTGDTRYAREFRTSAKLPTALVVDDSLSARRALVQFMRDAGYEVRQARDGMEAMDIILAHKPDLLLSDLEMPRMNGMELAGHVRANPGTKDLPIIMITSRAAAKHREEAIASGINVYLTKPFAEDELLEEIRKLRQSATVVSSS